MATHSTSWLVTHRSRSAEAESGGRAGRWLRWPAVGFLLLAVAAQQAFSADADFYVAADGKDSNPGTAAAPFATLARARQAVRGKVAAGFTKDLLVLIRGGIYPQTETLAFGPEDSGTER